LGIYPASVNKDFKGQQLQEDVAFYRFRSREERQRKTASSAGRAVMMRSPVCFMNGTQAGMNRPHGKRQCQNKHQQPSDLYYVRP
jgi:hypothetical protein